MFIKLKKHIKLKSIFFTFNSVRSNDIKPKLRPENRAENIRHPTIITILSQIGIANSLLVIRSHGSDPWWTNGCA